MSYGQGIGEAIGCVIVMAIAVTAVVVLGGSYFIFSSDEIVSKKPITPEIRLVTDGKKVDTLYVYKNEK